MPAYHKLKYVTSSRSSSRSSCSSLCSSSSSVTMPSSPCSGLSVTASTSGVLSSWIVQVGLFLCFLMGWGFCTVVPMVGLSNPYFLAIRVQWEAWRYQYEIRDLQAVGSLVASLGTGAGDRTSSGMAAIQDGLRGTGPVSSLLAFVSFFWMRRARR